MIGTGDYKTYGLDHIMVSVSQIRSCFRFSEKEKWGRNINDIAFCLLCPPYPKS